MLRLTVEPPSEALQPSLDRVAEGLIALPEDELDALGTAALAKAVGLARLGGAEALVLEAEPVGAALDASAAAAGLHLTRELLHLRRPLPVGEPWSLAVRPFVPVRDDEAWLELNNRAFAWHPEQAGWRHEDLASRMAEAWFEPAGFLLHERDGRLVGFCWTKVHVDEHPPAGEIFVVGVDPALQGHGLGRALVLAGLDHLAARALRVGMLYVEADNTPARRLYRSLGFHRHRSHRWYRLDLADPEAPRARHPAADHA